MRKILELLAPLPFLARNSWRQTYPNSLSLLGYAFGVALELAVYFFTAKAFGVRLPESFAGVNGDYFHFVVLGELAILLPATLSGTFVQGIREARANGSLENMLTLPRHAALTVFRLGAGGLFLQALRGILFLAFALSLFAFRPERAQLLWLATLVLAATPAFLGLGLLAAAVFLYCGRGEGAIRGAITTAAVFAGVYFPTSVYPIWLKEAGVFLSPFNALLELSRVSDFARLPLAAIASLLLWAVVSLPAAAWLMKAAGDRVRARGSLEMSHVVDFVQEST